MNKKCKSAIKKTGRLRKRQELKRKQSTFKEFERSIKEGKENINKII
jgi:hypothetical protein